MNRQSVINLAVKVFKNHQNLGDNDYSVEDALIYSLEQYDTGYDLTKEGYSQLLKEVYQNC